MVRAILLFLILPTAVYSTEYASNCALTFEDIVLRAMAGVLGDLEKYSGESESCQTNCHVDWDTFFVHPKKGFPNCQYSITMDYVCFHEDATTTTTTEAAAAAAANSGDIIMFIGCAPEDDPTALHRVYDDSLPSGDTRIMNFDHCSVGKNLLLIIFRNFSCNFMKLRNVPVNITACE